MTSDWSVVRRQTLPTPASYMLNDGNNPHSGSTTVKSLGMVAQAPQTPKTRLQQMPAGMTAQSGPALQETAA
jgi:hypothetical protein